MLRHGAMAACMGGCARRGARTLDWLLPLRNQETSWQNKVLASSTPRSVTVGEGRTVFGRRTSVQRTQRRPHAGCRGLARPHALQERAQHIEHKAVACHACLHALLPPELTYCSMRGFTRQVLLRPRKRADCAQPGKAHPGAGCVDGAAPLCSQLVERLQPPSSYI